MCFQKLEVIVGGEGWKKIKVVLIVYFTLYEGLMKSDMYN